MLEQENEKMAKKIKEAEEKKEAGAAPGTVDPSDDAANKAAKPKEDEAEDGKDGEKPPHDDEAQDKELIAQMLKKHLGDKASEDMHGIAKEAYEAAKGMGYEGEEAEKRAAYACEMAHHMAQKMAQAKKEGEGPKAPPAPVEASKPAPNQMESAKVIKLTADNAAMSEKLKKYEVKEFLEAELEKSELPRSVTKKFRECVADAKSTKEIADKLKLFKEAYTLGGGEANLIEYDFSRGEKPETVDNGTGLLSLAGAVKSE
jgi:hypothetical protein